MVHNSVRTKKKPINNNPNDIVINRKKKETIALIKDEADTYKNQKNKVKEFLTQRNNEFFKNLQSYKQQEKKQFYQTLNSNRIDRFGKVFKSIEGRLEDYYETVQTEGSDKFKKSIKLPDLKLNIKDVYSRLYHNVVFLSPKKKTGNIEQLDKEISKKLLEKGNARLKKTNFVVRNVIDSANGKEFTIKITDELLMQCFSKHSGGPSLERFKIQPPSKHKDAEFYINLLEIKDEEGNSLLHISVLDNIYDLVEYLLIKGANVNAQNNNGDTPLHLVIKKENTELIGLLLKYNAEIDILNKKNETPIDIASVEIRKSFNLESKLMMKRIQIKNGNIPLNK
jgi:hypothetical protein